MDNSVWAFFIFEVTVDRNNKIDRALIILLIVLVVVLAFFSLQRETQDAVTADQAGTAGPADFSHVVEAAMPSLVKVQNEGIAAHPDVFGKLSKGRDIQIAETSEGSGFFIDKAGLILTNYHVVDGAQQISVFTPDKKKYKAELVGGDILSDVALIKITPDFKVRPVTLGDSSRLKIGQWVIAMGNPLGLDFFTSAGIVSGFGPPGPNYIGFFDFIQADLNIEPGNSGGPLYNAHGVVVGINNAYLGPGTGIGFAIPINRAKDIVAMLQKNGTISRGFLGLIGQPLDAGLAERLGLKDIKGAMVSGILPGSPAEVGGLKAEDVILAFNGEPVENDRALQEKIYSLPAESKVELSVFRKGETIKLPVTLGELKAHSLVTQRVIMQCGLTLEPVKPEMARKLGIPSNGLMVLKVIPGCPSYEGGLRFGDIIRKVEGREVNSVQEFYNAYSRLRPGRHLLVQVYREGRPYYLTVKQD
ncbi:MAG TPA: trypsin-like peptidase domain-containing protein [Nitrospirota bacterium]